MPASLHERLGAHRVLDPPGGLPQPARRLDALAPLRTTELALAVERISLDAWSFRQLWGEAFEERLLALVRERGKLHNPSTDSGGTLLGVVVEIGPIAAAERGLAVGDRVVPLVSASAIPLVLERVLGVRPESAEVEVEGRAVLPLAFPVARAPVDLDPHLVLAAADTAGAPGLVHDLTEPGGRVAVLGANGTAGLLACAAARERGAAEVVGIDLVTDALERTGVAEPVRVDATDALSALDALDGFEADVVAHAAAAPGCEAAAVAAVAAEGTIVLFSLATSFQRCVNVADVFGKRPRMLIANALRLHHADLAYDLLRRYPAVREEIARR
ncbi:MAG: NAD-dependent epimerase/dehydratase family protein [Gaiellaceae bacterium]